jgi:hypothetical protein
VAIAFYGFIAIGIVEAGQNHKYSRAKLRQAQSVQSSSSLEVFPFLNHACTKKSVAPKEVTPDKVANCPPEPKPVVAPFAL